MIALDGDTKNSTFSELFKKDHPGRYIECYIAEQNMVTGLLSLGFVKCWYYTVGSGTSQSDSSESWVLIFFMCVFLDIKFCLMLIENLRLW